MRTDRDLLIAWMHAFLTDAHGDPKDMEAEILVDGALRTTAGPSLLGRSTAARSRWPA
jgi:hypothetical protein